MKKNYRFGLPRLLVFFVASICWTASTYAAGQQVEANPQLQPAVAAPQPHTDITGTWSGTLFSNHSGTAPFTITVVITRGANAHLTGNSSLSSECMRGAKLQATITGTSVVLAGSDEEGDNLTIQGTLDASGNIMKASYLMNGSATGRCETEDGKGQLARR